MKKILIVLMLVICRMSVAGEDLENCRWESGEAISADTCQDLREAAKFRAKRELEQQEKDREENERQEKMKLEQQEVDREEKAKQENEDQELKAMGEKRRREWNKKAPSIRANITKKLLDGVKKEVANHLKDPDSVKFRNIHAYDGETVCGEFNAKNSYGGYVGFQRFYGWDSANDLKEFTVTLEGAGNETDIAVFPKVWEKICAGRK